MHQKDPRRIAARVCDSRSPPVFKSRANPLSLRESSISLCDDNEDRLLCIRDGQCVISIRSLIETTKGLRVRVKTAVNMGPQRRARVPNRMSTQHPFAMLPPLLLAFVFTLANCSIPSPLTPVAKSPVSIKSPSGAQPFPDSVSINSISSPAVSLPPPPYARQKELQSTRTNKYGVITKASKQNEVWSYPFSVPRQHSSHSTRHAPLNQHQQLHYLFPPVSLAQPSGLTPETKNAVQQHGSRGLVEGKVFVAATITPTESDYTAPGTTSESEKTFDGNSPLVGGGTADNVAGDATAAAAAAATDDDDGNQSANQSNPTGDSHQSYGRLARAPTSRRAETFLETSSIEHALFPAQSELESGISAQAALGEPSELPPRATAASRGRHKTALDQHDDNEPAGPTIVENKRPSIAKITTDSLQAGSSSSPPLPLDEMEQKRGASLSQSQPRDLATATASIATTVVNVNSGGQFKQASGTTPRAMDHLNTLSEASDRNGKFGRQLVRTVRSVSSNFAHGMRPRHGERRNSMDANLIGQLTGDRDANAKLYRHRNEHDDDHEDYKFSEYDDLFLLNDFRLELGEQPSGQWSSSSSSKEKRSSNGQQLERGSKIHVDEILAPPVADALTLDKRASQVRTIYFGGFFPWLADEQIQSPSLETRTGANRHEQHQRQHGVVPGERARKLAGNSSSTPSGSQPSAAADATAGGANENELAATAAAAPSGAHTKKGKKMNSSNNNNNGNQQRRNQDKSGALLMGPPFLPSPPPLPPLSDSGNQDINNLTRPIVQGSQQQQLAASTTTGTQFTNSQTRHQLGKFISPAVRLALDHINTNQSILSAYKLEVVPRDTQCNATISLKQFFDMVYEEPKKMLLYGDACRVSTDPIAKASYFFDLIQISYADTDPIYTIENYPNFFRVVPSENALSLARIPFIRHFNWTRVGTIYQNLPRYSLPHSKLLTDLERFKIVIKQSVSLPGSVDGLQDRDLGDELRKLKEKDVRIILGNFDEEWALLLFCEAFRERMTGRKYQWLLTGFSESKLWHYYESKGSTCTRQELLVAMDGYIITDITPVTRSQHRTISGLMAHEYLDEYRRRAREMNISIGENKFYGYVYDGIWAIALALNRVDSWLRHYSRLAREGKVKLRPEVDNISSLLDFEYHQPIWVELIRKALEATKFEGVTGTVSFHKNERPGLITFSQFQAFRGMNEVIIGSYDALIDELDLNVGFSIIWRGSLPPIDYTIQRITPFRINRTLFVIISIMALLGIVLACVFLFVNIKFRDQRYIKMSSPYLNNLIIIGCILTFTSVIILGLDSGLTSEYNFPYICNARAWVLMAGFTLAFGSMFSKTFRVHSIFTNIKLHKKVIKDYKLFMVVFILLTFDVCILIVWQYFDPFYRETNNGTSIQDPDNEDVIIVPEMEHCQSKRMTIFLSVIYVYKGLLMAFGCFLAWETRHVSIPALNDSKYIGLSVYNVVIMCVIGASLSFILRDQQDASFVIISIFIIFCSTTTLCLVFVPKLIELKQNPRAGDHRVRATLKTFKKNYHDEALAANCRDIHGNLIGRGYGMNLNDRVKLLAEENGKQRSSLKEKTFELEALTSKYRKIQNMVQAGQYLQAVNTSASPIITTGPGGAATATCIAPGGGTSTQLHGAGGRPGSATPNPVGASSSMLFTSGPGGLTTVTNTTTAANTGGSQATLGAQTTTVLLTSRSPTRERVSFSAFHDELPVRAGGRAPAGGVSAGGSQQQDKSHSGAGSGGGGGGLRSSPMMSSVTQITNTTTTSSTTNNTTDLTGDLSSSRALISTATTSGSATSGGVGCVPGQCLKAMPRHRDHHVAHVDGADLGERVQAISKQVAASKQAQGGQPKAARFGDGRFKRAFTSQDDLDLFTILSYGKVSSSPPPPPAGSRSEADSKRRLDQWLEGPFSMLVLRQTNGPTGGKIDGQMLPGKCSRPAEAKQQRFSSFRKQTSQQVDVNNNRTWLAPATKAHVSLGRARERLPRTLSMIEYLGLNDFDLIARRHDKILRYRRRNVGRQLSCCASCSCCLMAAQQLEQHQKQQPTLSSRGFVRRTSNLGGHNHGRRSQMQMSDGNLGTTLSGDSSEPLNDSAEDYLQTISLMSCSTCCSLASQTYASHSELYHDHGDEDDDDDDDDEEDSRSTTGTHSSSGTGDGGGGGGGGARGHPGGGRRTTGGDGGGSSSRTISSSMSESSSAIVISGTGERRYVSECQSETTGNRGSRSSSLLTLNQAGGSCHHVHQHHAHGHHTHPVHELCDSGLPTKTPQRQRCRQHTHHLSSEAISSSQSNSSTSHATQIVTASERRESRPTTTTTTSRRTSNDRPHTGSLCTSGVLYGAAAIKDDANDAAAHVMLDSSSEPRASTSGGEPTASTLSPLSQTTNDDFNTLVNEEIKIDEDDKQAILTIKCDILEEL